MTTTERPNPIHQGRNVKRFREMLGLKQEALAVKLGADWNQKRISLLEAKEVIEEDIINQISNILGISPDAIKNFTEEAAFNIISNTFHNTSNENSTLIASSLNYQPTFNTIEKIVDLYERLLASEREKVELLKNKG